MRKDIELSPAFRKNAEEEQFLARLNAVLAPHEEQEYADLPELHPTLHIIGAPRSGTTLLSQLVASHLDVTCINHLVAAFWMAPVHGIRLSKKLLAGCRESSYSSRYGRTPGIHEPHEFGYFWSRLLNYDNLCQRGPEHEASIDWMQLRRVLLNMTHAAGGPIAFKSLLLGWHLEQTVRVLPKTCLVRIRRDPVENAVSIVRAREEYGGSIDQWVSLRPRECEQFVGAPVWTQAVSQVYHLERSMTEQLQRLPKANALEVGYDELCKDPKAVLLRIRELLANHAASVEILSDPPASFPQSKKSTAADELTTRVRAEVERFYGSIPAPAPSSAPAAFPTWPHFDDEMIEASTRVLRSAKVNYWTGDEGRQFEREFADFVGARHAIALANGTVALELALWSMDIGPGDEVIVPCRSFVATASAVAMRGAAPIFADIDRDSQNITAAAIEPLITERTKAIIVVHVGGWPCDMPAICELARRHHLRVIEDCAQSLGASIRGRQTGVWSDMAAFSFCQDKILTTAGEGGMVTTDDAGLWERAWSFKDHGKSWDAVYHRTHPEPFRWLHESVGTNWRMTEIQAAIGRVALRRVPEWVATRRRHATALHAALRDVPGLRLTLPHQDFFHSHYRYYAFVEPSQLTLGWTRNRIVEAIQAEGVPCGVGVCPEMYREGAFAFRGIGPKERCRVGQEVGETCLMFLVHPTLNDSHIRVTAEATHKVLCQAVGAPARKGAPLPPELRAA